MALLENQEDFPKLSQQTVSGSISTSANHFLAFATSRNDEYGILAKAAYLLHQNSRKIFQMYE